MIEGRPSPRWSIALGLALGLGHSASAQGYLLRHFSGTAPGELFGWALAGAGDLDGDGVLDLAVGRPLADYASIASAGQVNVFSGATGSPILILGGSTSYDGLGSAIAVPGDLDGDGFLDFVVGASAAEQARVFSGGSGNLLYTFYGTIPGDQFGYSVSGSGDLDGDGVPDLLVGAPHGGPGLHPPGHLLAYSGATGTRIHDIVGDVTHDFFAWSIAGLGDVNGDGVSDLLVGGSQVNPGGAPLAGRAYVFSGADASLLFAVDGAAALDQFGWAVAALDDLDGDGVSDFFVGAPQTISQGAGYARVHSGRSGALLLTLAGTAASDSFGNAVSSAGDADGDGVTDLLVGAPQLSFPPTGPGYAEVYSGASGLRLDRFWGTTVEDGYGYALGPAGDLDGDGFDDALIGAPQPPGPGYPGYAEVVSYVGFPFGSALFGTGCAGSGGFVPRVRVGGWPTVSTGNPAFGVFLSKALGGTTAVLLFGTVPLSPAPSLGFLGSPSCWLFVPPTIVFPRATVGSGAGTGRASVRFPLLPEPSLVGSLVYFQWYVADPGPGLVPGATSAALALFLL